MKLTKRTVDSVKPSSERFIVWDDQIKGFGLVVRPSGVLSYVFNYRSPEGRERRITLGQHGAITPEQARKLAAEHRHAVVHGGDPLESRQERRRALTIDELLDAYLEGEEFNDKAEITKAIDRGRINRHLRPLLGRRHVHVVTEADIRRAFAAIRDGKTAADVKTIARGRARVRGGPGAARMAIVLLSIVFNWGIRARLAKENPCKHIKLEAVGTRDEILEDATGYKRLFETLERMENERRIRTPAADAIRLIALTGCRRGEAAGLRWRHVERGRIVLPAREHKAGKRTGKPRVIALPAAAQAILARQPEGGPEDFVFTPAKGEGGALSSAPHKRKPPDARKQTLPTVRHPDVWLLIGAALVLEVDFHRR